MKGVLTQEPLTPGMKVIKNKDGVRNSHTDHAEVMFSLDGRPQENSGNVIGAASVTAATTNSALRHTMMNTTISLPESTKRTLLIP